MTTSTVQLKLSQTPEFRIPPIGEAVEVTSEVIKREPDAENVQPPADEPPHEEIKAKKTPTKTISPNKPVRLSRCIFNQSHGDGSFTMLA
ncbi:hypothetical protein PGT21_008519 [Puccinia graminis f. sp. tritici]|uniref:Uncharacterized protein n=1 Tax=Puccinia graminis f. sp. tritici TaxID=56615 RepID=A0A5B0PJE3_PUCGR|nr:hypothetical protein PGT21_008519 [Puccinia graminis f. sp. tritici]